MGEIYNSYVDRLQAEIDLKVEEGGMIISDPDIWILSTWFSDEGLSLGDKEEFFAAIDQMLQQDPEMHAVLKRGNIARMSGIKYEKAWSMQKAREQLHKSLEEGMEDIKAGRVYPFDAVMDEMEDLIQNHKKEN